MARLFSFKPGITLKGRKFKGLRGWAGKPSHPPLTDIPIGAYLIVAILDVISFWKGDGDTGRNLFVGATVVLVIGQAAGFLAAITGLVDWFKSTPKHSQVWRTANAHMLIMVTALSLGSLNFFTRLSDFNVTGSTETLNLILSLAAIAVMSVGATYGGSLVYDYAFNVEQDFDHAYEESETDKLPGGSG